MADPNARDAKLIQYLNEAYGKEKQLETALQAHIAMTERKPYKKRLQEHLKETKGHARAVERRIKKLGGSAEAGPISGGPAVGAANVAQTAANKAAALAQGPLHAVRGTGAAEKQLKNAKTEYQDEAEEIANYTAIEVLAESVGDAETVKIAKAIRRDEERMAKFLERQITQLTKAVVQEEVPAELRKKRARRGGRRRSASGGSSKSAASSSRRSSSASSRRSSGSPSSRRSSSSRSSSGRSGGGRSGSRSRSS